MFGVRNHNCTSEGSPTGVGADNKINDPQFALENPNLPLSDENRPLLIKEEGSPTATHALREGSPAINHGTARDNNSSFFNCPGIDQRGFTRPLNFSNDPLGNCDAGAVEFGAIPPRKVTAQIALASKPMTRFSPSSTPDGPAGTFFITATFTNKSATAIRKPFFQVLELSEGNVLFNSDTGQAGVGTTLTPNVGPDRLLRSGESVTVEFPIGLQTLEPFRFVLDLFGDPMS